MYADKEVSPFFIQLKFLTNYTKFDHQNMIFIEELEKMLGIESEEEDSKPETLVNRRTGEPTSRDASPY